MDGNLVDAERVAELRDEIGADEFGEVVEIFLEECDAAVERLSGAEAGAVEAELHFLRGAAMNLGLAALAAACQRGEAAAGAGEGASVDRAGVVDLYARSRAALLASEESRAA